MIKMSRASRRKCDHLDVIEVRTGALRRDVCEACGHVSIEFLHGLSGNADRRRFERAIEKPVHLVG